MEKNIEKEQPLVGEHSRLHKKIQGWSQRLAHYFYVFLGAILFPIYTLYFVFESRLSFTTLSNLELIFLVVSLILTIQIFLRTRKAGKKWHSALALVLRSYGIGLFAFLSLVGVTFFVLGFWWEMNYGSARSVPAEDIDLAFGVSFLVFFYISHFFVLLQLYLHRPPKLLALKTEKPVEKEPVQVLSEGKELSDDPR
ncbi:hypothetical protein SAMN05660443_2063 [Marinospirillum celere]|uniref:Uncharacterized protein n=1 Tax=Marinospirillum celere TaxID=1122252 RepID=A0A1I1HX00_9GAMM|nr:hypothetical protein [Marinospirillum celere]SFC28305.1 hypothetical protein SAMN05660443_2063 [Marinospirillum celere]